MNMQLGPVWWGVVLGTDDDDGTALRHSVAVTFTRSVSPLPGLDKFKLATWNKEALQTECFGDHQARAAYELCKTPIICRSLDAACEMCYNTECLWDH